MSEFSYLLRKLRLGIVCRTSLTDGMPRISSAKSGYCATSVHLLRMRLTTTQSIFFSFSIDQSNTMSCGSCISISSEPEYTKLSPSSETPTASPPFSFQVTEQNTWPSTATRSAADSVSLSISFFCHKSLASALPIFAVCRGLESLMSVRASQLKRCLVMTDTN